VITGHLGVAAAARGRWPVVPLTWLVVASVAPDLLDVAYPAAAITAAVLGGIAFLTTGSRVAGLLVAGVVLAHLPLDFVTGHKLYWPGGPLLGLQLYDRPLLDFLAEVPVLLAGWWMLRRTGRGPRWAVVGAAIGGLVLVQGAFDLAQGGLKPTACEWSAVAGGYRVPGMRYGVTGLPVNGFIRSR